MKLADAALLAKAATNIAAEIETAAPGLPDWAKQATLTVALQRFEVTAPFQRMASLPDTIGNTELADVYAR